MNHWLDYTLFNFFLPILYRFFHCCVRSFDLNWFLREFVTQCIQIHWFISNYIELYSNLLDLYIFQYIWEIFICWWFFWVFRNKKYAQRNMTPIRPILTPWTPFWSHFVEQRDNVLFYLTSCFLARAGYTCVNI